MCTNLTFRQSDGLDESFQSIKLQSCKTKALGNNADHLLIFRRTGSGIFLQILVCISLQFFYNAACNQFQRALGCRETYKRTSINQRRTSNADMYFFGTIAV